MFNCCERIFGFVRAKAASIDLQPTAREPPSPRIKYEMNVRSKGITISPGKNGEPNVGGKGTVLVSSLALEQDSAYWEVKVVKGGSFLIGVSRALEGEALDAPLTWALEVQPDSSGAEGAAPPPPAPAAAATTEEKDEQSATPSSSSTTNPSPPELQAKKKEGITCVEGDVIGCIFAQSEFPMLRFLKNGQALDSQSVERVRGLVYPALHLKSEGCVLHFAFHELDWVHPPPSSRYPPVMESRDMI